MFPFVRFPGVDAVLGPEMKSIGEVMGIDSSFGLAYAKSQQGAGHILPLEETVFISVHNANKRDIIMPGISPSQDSFQQRRESGLLEVAVAGQGFGDIHCAHNDERDAVGQRPVLVGTLGV